MLRALIIVLFMVLILLLAAVAAMMTVNAVGFHGISGFILGFLLFSGILMASVLVLAAINDRINRNVANYDNGHKHNPE